MIIICLDTLSNLKVVFFPYFLYNLYLDVDNILFGGYHGR